MINPVPTGPSTTGMYHLQSDKASDYCVVIGHNDVSNLDWLKCAPLGQRPIQVFRHPIYNQTALGKDDFNYFYPALQRSVSIGLDLSLYLL